MICNPSNGNNEAVRLCLAATRPIIFLSTLHCFRYLGSARLDTQCARSTLLRLHFQQLVYVRLVAHDEVALNLTENELAKYQNLINNRPRKILNFNTPNNVFLIMCLYLS
jgi:hypothetical protein